VNSLTTETRLRIFHTVLPTHSGTGGAAFRYIETFISSFIAWTQNGGKLAVERLFPLEEVIEHLLQDLVAQGDRTA
jgi:hypothetical protein